MMFPLKAIFLTIAGWFIIPFLAWCTPATATHYRWLDGIFGNGTPDTINGDAHYHELVPNLFWRRYRWTAFRNPLNAWYYSHGPEGVTKR